jgi:hypothetical protein
MTTIHLFMAPSGEALYYFFRKHFVFGNLPIRNEDRRRVCLADHGGLMISRIQRLNVGFPSLVNAGFSKHIFLTYKHLNRRVVDFTKAALLLIAALLLLFPAMFLSLMNLACA